MVTVGHRFAPLLALSAGALVPGAGFGQDTETDDARGWLGVRVEERYNCGWETTEDWKNCALVTRIREIQEDGPAARAGVLAGDRLVAIDGQDITLDNWPGLLGSIRRGTAIVFDVTRAGDPYTFRVVPAVRPADPDRVPMIGRRTIVAVSGSPESTVRVLRLNDPSGSDRVGFALTFRDTEDIGLAIEPSAVREVNGRLEVRFVRDRPIPEHQNLRRELLENLERETESAYRDFSSVLRRVGQIRARLSAREFRRGMTQLARGRYGRGRSRYAFPSHLRGGGVRSGAQVFGSRRLGRTPGASGRTGNDHRARGAAAGRSPGACGRGSDA